MNPLARRKGPSMNAETIHTFAKCLSFADLISESKVYVKARVGPD